jgi:hypothetical protein
MGTYHSSLMIVVWAFSEEKLEPRDDGTQLVGWLVGINDLLPSCNNIMGQDSTLITCNIFFLWLFALYYSELLFCCM